MSGFIYNGKSTKNILDDSELILVSFDSLTSITGHQRTEDIGESSYVHPIPNEYGTQYQQLEIEYGLIKKNLSAYTENEQEIIEAWLTSPKTSKQLQFIDCKGNISDEIYCGKFLSTEWYISGEGLIGLRFTFKNNTAYPVRHFSETYTITSNDTISLNCDSDEFEEYIYPTIIINASENGTVTITNTSDSSNSMNINVRNQLPMILDCKHCIPKDGTTSGIFSYKDLGWLDIGSIYWLRLIPGENILKITGNAKITIEYDTVCKKVGCWL